MLKTFLKVTWVFPNKMQKRLITCFFYKQSPKLTWSRVNTVKAMGMMQTLSIPIPDHRRIKKTQTDIIDLCRGKLEQKEYRGARLYYNLGQYRAAAIAFTSVLNNYPESASGEELKY